MARATKTREFSSPTEESDWWDQLSIEELIALSEPDDEDIKFIDARPKKAISLRLTESMITDAKRIANELGIGYQTLFRMWLMEGLRRHRRREIEDQRHPHASRRKPTPPPATRR